jgi:hypothetical protein
MDAPKTMLGNIAVSAVALSIGVGTGAALGYYASPMPITNKQIGALEGGVLGGLLTAFAGIVISTKDADWRKVGDTTALIGVGGIAALALYGVVTQKPSAAPVQPLTP